jgi:hypothetical protein
MQGLGYEAHLGHGQIDEAEEGLTMYLAGAQTAQSDLQLNHVLAGLKLPAVRG